MKAPTRRFTGVDPSRYTLVTRALAALRSWPWLGTVKTLGRRFREDRLALTAGSLTFTTIISLVPLVTVVLAIFAAFPVFGTLQGALERWLLSALVPETISRQVLGWVTQFSSRANKLGALGLGALVVSTLALMLTIDRTLNGIWRVRRPRPTAQRILVYWASLTLGPLFVAITLGATSFALSASRGYFGPVPGGLAFVVGSVDFVFVALGIAALFYFVPNTHVRWSHALTGGLVVACGLGLARRLLALWFGAVPTYSVVYGAFATLPIFLVWMYLGWCIVLTGAVVAAYLPVARMRVHWRSSPGSRFQLAVEMLRRLDGLRRDGGIGLRSEQLAAGLATDPLQVETVLQVLVELDWVGRLADDSAPRYVLLRDPAQTPAAPLLARLLLEPNDDIGPFWSAAQFDRLTLADAIARPAPTQPVSAVP